MLLFSPSEWTLSSFFSLTKDLFFFFLPQNGPFLLFSPSDGPFLCLASFRSVLCNYYYFASACFVQLLERRFWTGRTPKLCFCHSGFTSGGHAGGTCWRCLFTLSYVICLFKSFNTGIHLFLFFVFDETPRSCSFSSKTPRFPFFIRFDKNWRFHFLARTGTADSEAGVPKTKR